jgi:hypothetical protein
MPGELGANEVAAVAVLRARRSLPSASEGNILKHQIVGGRARG